MKPETTREVEIARAAYIRGMQDERTYWREAMRRMYPDHHYAENAFPMPAEVTP